MLLAKLIILALAIDIALVLLEGVFPYFREHNILPIGGTSVSQLGVLLGLAVIIDAIWDVFRRR
jgi:hypothetical protein